MFSIVPRILAEEVVPMMRMADELARWPAVWTRTMAQPLARLGESEVHNTDKEYRIRMDLRHFKPEEVKISSDNHRISINAKHEEQQDDHGFISRQVSRVYKLPDDVDPKSITSALTEHGILNIKVQKKAIEPPKETPIPVDFKNSKLLYSNLKRKKEGLRFLAGLVGAPTPQEDHGVPPIAPEVGSTKPRPPFIFQCAITQQPMKVQKSESGHGQRQSTALPHSFLSAHVQSAEPKKCKRGVGMPVAHLPTLQKNVPKKME